MYTECFDHNCLGLLFIVVLNIFLPKTDGASERIVNGVEARAYEFPFMAALYRQRYIPYIGEFYFSCGGTLITKRHVVTAAHCIGEPEHRYKVHLGGHYSDGDFEATRINVLKWKKHPDYLQNFSVGLPRNDIAVLTLEDEVNFNNYEHVRAIALPNMDDMRTSETCTVIGWGQLTFNDTSISDVLRKLEMKMLPDSECRDHLDPKYIIEGDSCLNKTLAGICSGDSGGPAVCGKAPKSLSFFGVASGVGFLCHHIGRVSFYARVGYKPHLEFIKKIASYDLGKERTTTTTKKGDTGIGVSDVLGVSKIAAITATAPGIIITTKMWRLLCHN